MALTTANTKILTPNFAKNRLHQALLLIYALVWTWAAWEPHDRSDWLLENMLVFITAGVLWFYYKRRPLSDWSYILIFAFMVLHTVGSHYTYSLVPMGDWVKETMQFERNHYDRLVHFAFGFLLAYPIREAFMRAVQMPPRWASVFAFMAVATFSTFYEILEWAAVQVVDPAAGLAFLGTQGDVFDAQKDSALAVLGAAITLIIVFEFRWLHGKKA